MFKQQPFIRTVVYLFLCIVLVGTGFVAGIFVRGQHETVVAQEENQTEFRLLKQVDQLVDQHFVYELPAASNREYAAIRGYLGSLEDRYTFFNEPPVAASESHALAGRYGGIGVSIIRNEAGQVELYPYPDSPAERIGVLNGDVLVRVNETPIEPTMHLELVRQMMRGEIIEGEASGVQLTVRQSSSEEMRVYDILFEEIRVPSVLTRIVAETPKIGYIQISSFTSRTPEELIEALAQLRSQNIQGVILDLRNNSGGLLQESINITDEFIDNGVIFREVSRADGEKITEGQAGGALTDLPMVALINQRTGSAAEIVAGALKDNERALLIGQQTLGKGSVQFIFGLEDGSSIHITTSVWLTPDGNPIDGIGLAPHIDMIPDENGRDVELGEALRQLTQIVNG